VTITSNIQISNRTVPRAITQESIFTQGSAYIYSSLQVLNKAFINPHENGRCSREIDTRAHNTGGAHLYACAVPSDCLIVTQPFARFESAIYRKSTCESISHQSINARFIKKIIGLFIKRNRCTLNNDSLKRYPAFYVIESHTFYYIYYILSYILKRYHINRLKKDQKFIFWIMIIWRIY